MLLKDCVYAIHMFEYILVQLNTRKLLRIFVILINTDDFNIMS